MSALTAVAVMVGLTSVLATILVVANRWLSVPVDQRADRVEQMLPRTNCGACGYPGCRAFAEALIRGEVLPGKCNVSTTGEQTRIAAFLGIQVGDRQHRLVARLACAGGNNVAPKRAHYEGEQSCGAAALVSGGGKACFWGCLGLADCERACDFNAISMTDQALPTVNESLCTGCGDCVEVCPKDLFSLQPIEQRLWVACSSRAEGDAVLAQCEVGCTACGRCAVDAPDGITMHHGLPVINPIAPPSTNASTRRCPTGAIVWLDPDRGPSKGPSAHHVIRRGPLPEANS